MAKMQIELTQFGKNGWEFTVITDGQQRATYRTNGEGDGLWCYQKNGGTNIDYVDGQPKYSPCYEFKQTIGTCDFSLPRDEKRARAKIRYEWSKEFY